MPIVDTDVIVVGSGFGGAALALRLGQAGLRVRIIERGSAIGPPQTRDLLHQTDAFRQTQDPQYIRKYIKGLGSEHLHFTFAEALGGGSGFYEMASFRAPSLAFQARDAAQRPLWPAGLDRKAFDPWYDLAEKMLHIEQVAASDVPKTGLAFHQMMKNLDYSCERARYAVQNCMGSGFCATGCIYGAKQSLHLNYLAEATRCGVEIECELDAIDVAAVDAREATSGDAFDGVPSRYLVRCRRTGSTEVVGYRAKLVVLAGGTVGTAALLLRSRPGLRHLSDQVGRNVAFNGGVKAAGLLGEEIVDGDMFTGRSHPGVISYEFLASHGITITAGKAMPIAAISGARLRLADERRDPDWWGAAHVELMQKYRRRVMALVSFGLTPPDGRITLDGAGKPRVELRPSADLEMYARDTMELLHSIFRRNGCRIVTLEWLKGSGEAHQGTYFSTAHQTGSARMAASAREGVTDRHGEVFGHPGLYVSDGAAIPSSLAVNTSLTILANAERIAVGVRERYGLVSA
ncbi:MAG: GMC oxidoreductase [Gemmatimonadales bacterium]